MLTDVQLKSLQRFDDCTLEVQQTSTFNGGVVVMFKLTSPRGEGCKDAVEHRVAFFPNGSSHAAFNMLAGQY